MTGKTESETFPSPDLTVTNVWPGDDQAADAEFRRFEDLARNLIAVPKTEISED